MIAGRNPADFPEELVNHPYLIGHGTDDTAVPIQPNSLRLRDDVNQLGGDVTLHISSGGHSSSNYAVYNVELITQALIKAKSQMLKIRTIVQNSEP